ncbi:MAG TPA: efflux RND transporter periplasmic adaptor subunit [Candidatus Udaeobacter sp.]|nr:efflux RND transporter periplasmic adaptor subunit [Candidatus Udaeobacter sp.]
MCRYRTGLESERNRRLAAFALLIALLAGCGQQQASQQAAPPPPAVGVQLAAIKGVVRSYEFIGRIQAIGIVALRARVEGFLDKVLFREGQDVKAGDLLYQIEKAPYQALVQQAEANVAADQAEAVNAQLQYNRSLQLVKSQFTPQATVDRDKATFDSARAHILQTQAALAQAEINLGYTDIRSPIDGRIGRTAYTQGNLVNAASGVLATIVSQDPIYALFPVSVQQLEDIRQSRHEQSGQPIKIEILVLLANGQEYPHPGVWNYTDVQVNQQTDTLLMRATLPNPERQLTDGEYVTVVVRERKEQPRLVVPQAALQIDQAGSYVLIVDSADKVELRRITLGASEATDVVVASGLKEGERVIVDGVQKVRPDETVKVTVLPASGGD